LHGVVFEIFVFRRLRRPRCRAPGGSSSPAATCDRACSAT
jgi:hypothetical protein